MNNEEKQLLLRDLCGRLPYGVKMKYKDDSGYEVLCQIDTFYKDIDGFHCLLRTAGPYGGFQDLNELKPYLRPMSSMTEEERDELREFCGKEEGILYDIGISGAINAPAIIDYLNARHFDFRNLIEKGLAIEAPEGMYEIK